MPGSNPGEPRVWARPAETSAADSHPEPYRDHANAVIGKAIQRVPETATLSNGVGVRDLLRVLAWTHDIGKGTTWSQHKLSNHAPPVVEQPGSKVTHSPLGARFTGWLLSTLDADNYTIAIAMVTVARHHGTIPDTGTYLQKLTENDSQWAKMQSQAENIQSHQPEFASEVLTAATSAAVGGVTDKPDKQPAYADFVSALEDGSLRDELKEVVEVDYDLASGLQIARSGSDLTSETGYTDLLQLWGSLKASDALAASTAETQPPSRRAHSVAVDAHINAMEPAPEGSLAARLNETRERARQSALDTVTSVSTDPGLYTLTLPTGAGKTLTGIQSALRLREEAKSDAPIVYALPYTSILDQTANVFEDVFGTSTQTDLLALHHYLETLIGGDGDDHGGESRAAGDDAEQAGRTEPHIGSDMPSRAQINKDSRDAWLADLTLTTTVQLWESLAGPERSQATKLPSLYGSTIILDEPQTLPLSWWPAVETLIDTLIETFQARVILLSATQPDFETDHEPVELGDSSPTDLPDRVRYHFDESILSIPRSHDDAGRTLGQSVTEEGGNTLAICNTIDSAQALFDAAVDSLEADGVSAVNIHSLYDDLIDQTADTVTGSLPDPDAITEAVRSLPPDVVLTCPLTTRHRPCDRGRILEALSTLLATEGESRPPPILAVTTQLVEAGVDISFDRLYRDFAPYDTLIQAAGRCNREYERGVGTGKVTVWRLAAPDAQRSTTAPSELIYGEGVNLLDTTRGVLRELDVDDSGTEVVPECDITTAESRYQTRVTNRRPSESAISEAISECAGDDLLSASLIENRPTVSTIVSKTQAGDDLCAEYWAASEAGDYDRVSAILSKLRRLQVDLPDPPPTTTPVTSVGDQLDDGLYALPHKQIATSDAHHERHGVQHPP